MAYFVRQSEVEVFTKYNFIYLLIVTNRIISNKVEMSIFVFIHISTSLFRKKIVFSFRKLISKKIIFKEKLNY